MEIQEARSAHKSYNSNDRITILVSGAAGALGDAICHEALKRSWKVIAVTRRPAPVITQDHTVVYPIICDITSPSCILTMNAALARLGEPIDVIVNCAGVSGDKLYLSEITAEELHRLFDVHVVGALHVIRGAFAFMNRDKIPAIVNISSRMGSLEANASGYYSAIPASYSYRIAKAAQNMLTLALAADPELDGIKVAAIHPGEFKSAMASIDAVQYTKDMAVKLADFISRHEIWEQGIFHSLTDSRLPW